MHRPTDLRTIHFHGARYSMNLETATRNQINFLKRSAKIKDADISKVLHLYRKVDVLPRFCGKTIEPKSSYNLSETPTTNDILEWIAHLHKLRPLLYRNDLQRNDGTISFDILEAHKRQQDGTGLIPFVNENEHLFSIRNATSPRDDVEVPVICDAVDDYTRFLSLVRHCDLNDLESKLVPSKWIDLVWHGHLNVHGCYVRDMINMLGRVLEHDDTISYKQWCWQREYTKHLWLRQFPDKKSLYLEKK